jgi:hypothetical protein
MYDLRAIHRMSCLSRCHSFAKTDASTRRNQATQKVNLPYFLWLNQSSGGTGRCPVGGQIAPLHRFGSEERLNTCLRPSEDQRMHIMRALVGIHGFKVHHMTDHLKLS